MIINILDLKTNEIKKNPMLSSYFISPKNIRTKKKIQKTNKPTNKQSIYHQTGHTYTKNEEKKTQAHPV